MESRDRYIQKMRLLCGACHREIFDETIRVMAEDRTINERTEKYSSCPYCENDRVFIDEKMESKDRYIQKIVELTRETDTLKIELERQSAEIEWLTAECIKIRDEADEFKSRLASIADDNYLEVWEEPWCPEVQRIMNKVLALARGDVEDETFSAR